MGLPAFSEFKSYWPLSITQRSLHIADGLILAAKVHGAVLVFNSGKIHQNIRKKMKERIKEANGVVIGGVINRANYRKSDYSYYRYYRQYSKYYHHTSDDSEMYAIASAQNL